MVGSGRISNSSKLLCMFSLPTSKKRIRWKIAEKCDDIIFSIISLWDFFQRLKGSQLLSPWSVLAKFELIQALMYIMVTCKFEMNQIKNVRENVMTSFFPL